MYTIFKLRRFDDLFLINLFLNIQANEFRQLLCDYIFLFFNRFYFTRRSISKDQT